VATFLGPLADGRTLSQRHQDTTWLQRLGAGEDAERRRFEHDRKTAIAAAPALPGAAGRRRAHGRTPWLMRRPGSDAEVDLTAWHAQYGWDLMLADLIQKRAPELLTDRADSAGGNVHIICPMSDLHGTARDDGTFVWDGCGWPPPASGTGFRRGGMFCNHTGCSGRSEGENLAVLLDAGVLTWADLDAIERRITETRRAAVAELPPVESELFEETEGGGDEQQAEKPRASPPPSSSSPMKDGDRPPPLPSADAGGGARAGPKLNWRDLDPREDVAKWIDRLNQDYMIIGDGGPSVIEEQFDPELNSYGYIPYKPQALPTLFDHHRVCIDVDKKGSRILENPVKVWLQHPKARRYRKGLGFNPAGLRDPEKYNLWKGWGVVPRPGDWSRMQKHILEVLCRGDQTAYAYLIGWMAWRVQHPDRKPEVLVVLRGKEGSGRGLLGHALLHLAGAHGIYINSADRLLGRFNAFLRNKIFAFFDEAFFAGDKKHEGLLKSLVTEGRQPIEAKFKELQEMLDRLGAIAASNNQWVVPAGLNSRRFFVLDVNDARLKDFPYFAAIEEQLKGGGYEAMLWDLLHRDLTGFNIRDIPETAALVEQRRLTLSGPHAWLEQVLSRGFVWESKLGLHDHFGRWHPKTSMDLLYRSYEAFIRSRSLERHPLSRELLGGFLQEMGYAPVRWRNAVIDEGWVPVSKNSTRRQPGLIKTPRAHGYAFGNLAAARAQFCKTTGLPDKWADAEGEDVDEDESTPGDEQAPVAGDTDRLDDV
jgi:hypothetical protein